MVHIGSIYKTN